MTLHSSEAQFVDLCRLLSLPAAFVSPAGVIVDSSDAVAEMLGCARSDLIGRPLAPFGSVPDQVIALHEETIKGGTVRNRELDLRGPEGQSIAVGVSTLARTDNTGTIVGYLVAFRDSYKRRRAAAEGEFNEHLESLLRISQYSAEDVERLLELALDKAIALTGSKIGFVQRYDEQKQQFAPSFWSREVKAECTIPGSRMTHRPAEAGLWGEVVRQRKPILINDYAAPHAYRRGYPTGHVPLRRFLGIPVFDRGRIVMVVGVANKEGEYDPSDIRQLTLLMDVVWRITDRTRTDEELRKLSRAVEQSPTTIVITDPDGTIEYVNPKFTELTGYTREEAIGRNSRILKTDYHNVEFYRTMWQTIKSGLEWRGEFLNRDRNGQQFWESASISAVTDEQGVIRHFVAVKEDITIRKRILARLRERNRRLVALDQEKNRFLGIAAHDLRNPLGMIFSYSEVLIDGLCGPLNAEQRQYVAVVKERSEFLCRLINNLLDVAKIESGKVQLELRPTDLADLAERIVTLNRPIAARKRIQLLLERRGEIPLLSVDPLKIEQVLDNLITNAVKFSAPETTTSIEIARADDNVTISVRDQGPGIPAGELGRLFKPFSRGSAQATAGESSTGLGLLIVKKIVESHRGTIHVESELGRGSIFTVTLPVA